MTSSLFASCMKYRHVFQLLLIMSAVYFYCNDAAIIRKKKTGTPPRTPSPEEIEFMTPKKAALMVAYEVYGRFNGTRFPTYTKRKAEELDVRGWVRYNQKKKCIYGVLEGEEKKVDKMKNWLDRLGSPGSYINYTIFGEEIPVNKTYLFTEFKYHMW